MNGYSIQAHQRPPRFLADNSVTLSFETGELGRADETALLDYKGVVGTLTFIPENTPVKEPVEMGGEYKQKTPAQRLRSTLYILHQSLGIQEEFELYYKNEMNKFIEQVKERI